jgi:hypothetical protein
VKAHDVKSRRPRALDRRAAAWADRAIRDYQR